MKTRIYAAPAVKWLNERQRRNTRYSETENIKSTIPSQHKSFSQCCLDVGIKPTLVKPLLFTGQSSRCKTVSLAKIPM